MSILARRPGGVSIKPNKGGMEEGMKWRSAIEEGGKGDLHCQT